MVFYSMARVKVSAAREAFGRMVYSIYPRIPYIAIQKMAEAVLPATRANELARHCYDENIFSTGSRKPGSRSPPDSSSADERVAVRLGPS